MTLFLRTFGPIELVTAAGHKVPGAGVQPKPLLILALAALSPGGVSRDRLLKAIWPGVERERARASLKQHLYALRRATGLTDLVAEAGRISIPEGQLRIDALEFNELVDAGRLVEAGRLLRGDLLADVELDPRPGDELNRMVTDLRERWASRAALVRSRTPPPDGPADLRHPGATRNTMVAAERELRAASRRFVHGVVTLPGDAAAAAHRVVWCMHDLLEAMTSAGIAGLPDAVISESLAEARTLWGRSEILRAGHDEGRGLTVAGEEWLLAGTPRSSDPVGRALEQYLLRSTYAGDLRMLHAWQAGALYRLFGRVEPGGARVLILGGVSMRMLADELPLLHRPVDQLVYAPEDGAAVALARLRLEPLGLRFSGIEGDRITGLDGIAAIAPFDLVLCGDMLDAMTARSAAWLMQRLVTMLAPGGRLLCSAQSETNALIAWRRHIVGWPAVPRDREDMLALAPDPRDLEVECIMSPGAEQWWLSIGRRAG